MNWPVGQAGVERQCWTPAEFDSSKKQRRGVEAGGMGKATAAHDEQGDNSERSRLCQGDPAAAWQLGRADPLRSAWDE